MITSDLRWAPHRGAMHVETVAAEVLVERLEPRVKAGARAGARAR